MSIKRTDRMREVLSPAAGPWGGGVPGAVQRAQGVGGDAAPRPQRTRGAGVARPHPWWRTGLDPSGSEIPVRLRDHRMVAIKRRIAHRAAALIPAVQAVALTGGVTTGEVAIAPGSSQRDRHELADDRRRLRRQRT